MNISLELQHNLIRLILENSSLFKDFNQIFLFGSAIKEATCPHDIDLLLIYSIYNDGIVENANLILSLLEQELFLPVDLTILSRDELLNTQFLNRIHRYVVLK